MKVIFALKQEDESTANIYLISMQWFRQWHSFVREKDCDPPGPIDNTPIIYTNSKTGQIHLKQGLFVSFTLVQFFYVTEIYITGF